MVTKDAARNGVKPEAAQKGGGFRVPERTAHIQFEDTDYDGAEVWIRLNVSFARYLELREASEAGDQARMTRMFGDNMLDRWNLEDDDGIPIPADGDGMMQIPLDFATLIITQWVDTVSDVPDPLGQPSEDLSMLEAASTVTDDE